MQKIKSVFYNKVRNETFLLALIYTLGHIVIASASAYFITGQHYKWLH